MSNKNHIPNLHHETSTEELCRQLQESTNPVTQASLKQCLRAREETIPTPTDYNNEVHLWS